MWPELKSKFGFDSCADDVELFAEMLAQRPIHALNTVVTAKELKYMKEMARERFDKVTKVLRAMPNGMMLVIRYTEFTSFAL